MGGSFGDDPLTMVRGIASVVAHELGGTLQALFTYTALAESAPQAGHVAKVRECAQRLRRQLATLRDFAHATGEPASVDIVPLVEAALTGEPGDPRTSGHGPSAPQLVRVVVPSLILALGATVRGLRQAAEPPARLRAAVRAGAEGVTVLFYEGQDTDEPARRLEPREGGTVGMDLWLAAVVFAELGGALALAGLPGARRVELTLPAAPPAPPPEVQP